MRLPFSTDDGIGARAALGLIALQADETVEEECRRLVALPQVALFCSRVACATEISAHSLAAMKEALPTAVALLPTSGLNAVAYACTSGATVIGEQEVQRLIQLAHPQAAVTTPLTAAKAALTALGVRRIALVVPYAPAVTAMIRTALEAAGFIVVACRSFEVSDDRVVARITPESCLKAIIRTAQATTADGVFISCTNLRALSVIDEAEATLGIPVISSNQAMAWHLLRLAGLSEKSEQGGKLLRL